MSAKCTKKKSNSLPGALRNKAFECGELIVKATPYAHVISMSQNAKYCDWCALPPKTGKLRKCSACQYEHYCDQQCQKGAWKYHKFECALLKARMPLIPADNVRLLTKILWNIGQGIVQAKDDPGWRVWNDLCHHSNVIRTDEERSRQFRETSSTVLQYVGAQKMKQYGMQSAADMLPEFGRMVFNGYTLIYLDSEMVGAAVYVSPSMFNHSCAPNAAHTTIGTTLYIRALRDIDTAKEEILVNYIDPMSSRQSRQDVLWKDYYFHCECSKCSDESGEASLESCICPFCEGDVVKMSGGNPLCLQCRKSMEDVKYLASCEKAVVDANKLSADALKKKDMNINLLKDFVSTNHLLSQRNVNLTMVKYNLYAMFSEQGDNAAAYKLGEELFELFKLYYPEVYPLHGAHQVKQARLAWHLDKYDKALVHYRTALRLLIKTHGSTHPLTKTAKSDVIECERDQFIYNKIVM